MPNHQLTSRGDRYAPATRTWSRCITRSTTIACEPNHAARGDLVERLALEVEVAGVARAEEAPGVGRQVDRAAQVGTLRRERDHRLFRSVGLADQPDRADRLPRVLHPGVLTLVDD